MATNRKSTSRPQHGHDEEDVPPPDLARRASRQEMIQAARSRTHSNGSTLGAFYQEETPTAKPAPRRRRSSRRPSQSPAPKTPVLPKMTTTSDTGPPRTPAPTTGSDLGDVASKALLGLADEDISELMGGPPIKPPKMRRPHHGPSGSNSKARGRQSPPPTAGSHLPTILDDSEQHHGRLVGGLPANTGVGIRSSMRQSMHTIDSLRVSEATVDLEDDVVTALSHLDRDNNLFLSDVTGGAVDRKQSLLGSSIFDNHAPPVNFPPKAASHSQQSSAASTQQQEIANFSAMLHADYGAIDDPATKPRPPPNVELPDERHKPPHSAPSSNGVSFEDSTEDDLLSVDDEINERDSSFLGFLDPTEWLIRDLKFDQTTGLPYFPEKVSAAGFIRYLLYNPIAPEFTSLQQFSWAVILGILMGFYTAFWKEIIEHSVDVMWKEIPEALLEWGVFTELDGAFPLYHWMWICPAFWGGLLSYIFAALPTPIPGQNEWITAVHTQGVQDSETFFYLFVLSTLGMASGLSLGPELPLVLTSGMIGSWLGIQCKQTVLQARVMNITCASAAVGGFFGFPMAGALFVLEIPHRMGLQYFEALSPATIASIVAVLCNRMVTGNDVTGYYSYPFLTTSLPSQIFSSAIFFGIFGAVVGILYATIVLKLKGLVHDFFHAPHDHHDEDKVEETPLEHEKAPLIGQKDHTISGKTEDAHPSFFENTMTKLHKCFCCVIPHEPQRALAAGVVAGALSGGVGMIFPQVMFWGEAQLQSMIDKGRTPLPIFGREDEPTAALTANALCMIDSDDPEAVKAGFSMFCAFSITLAKIVVTGLSLGTGIIGGHFWGPLFSGCVASHFLVDVAKMLDDKIGFGGALAAYPCVAILCTMGSTHVVTFRAHTAIMLILTLTISAFDPEDSANGTKTAVAGDYSAVFPLLVVSVFVALMVSRQTVFYKAQRSRVDISARPEVLCQPGQEGMPVVVNYDGGDEDFHWQDDDEGSYSDVSDTDPVAPGRSSDEQQQFAENVTREDIEKNFKESVGAMAKATPPENTKNKNFVDPPFARQNSTETQGSRGRGLSPLPPRPKNASGEFKPSGKANSSEAPDLGAMSSSRLDELLAMPMDNNPTKGAKPTHRRIQSAPNVDFGQKSKRTRAGNGGGAGSSGGIGASGARHNRSDSFGSQASAKIMRVATVGQLSLEQPSLMEQALQRSATSAIVQSRHVRHPSLPTSRRTASHSRQGSASSFGAYSSGPSIQVAEVERAFTSAVNQQQAGTDASSRTLAGIHSLAVGGGTVNASKRV